MGDVREGFSEEVATLAYVAVTQAQVGLGWVGITTGLETLECGICGLCRTRTSSLLCSENEVGPGVAPERCAAGLKRALNAAQRGADLPTGDSL